jgi:mono/diheme cytochrome c family protein
MKIKSPLTDAAILLLALTLSGCGDADHHEGESDMDEHHEHAGTSHVQGGHMAHMDEVRAWLKDELKDRYDQPVPEADEATFARGREIYSRTCVTCHGVSGKGDGPAAVAFTQKPADFTDAAHSAYYSDAGRIHIIEKGVAGTPMTGWANLLNPDEIQAVYAYVRSLREKPGDVVPTVADGAYTCPMHPEVASAQPGKCSKCGMALVLKEARHEHGEHAH